MQSEESKNSQRLPIWSRCIPFPHEYNRTTCRSELCTICNFDQSLRLQIKKVRVKHIGRFIFSVTVNNVLETTHNLMKNVFNFHVLGWRREATLSIWILTAPTCWKIWSRRMYIQILMRPSGLFGIPTTYLHWQSGWYYSVTHSQPCYTVRVIPALTTNCGHAAKRWSNFKEKIDAGNSTPTGSTKMLHISSSSSKFY